MADDLDNVQPELPPIMNLATPDGFRKTRQSLGLSRARLGEIIGYSERQIYNYESGKKPISRAAQWAIYGMVRISHPRKDKPPFNINELRVRDYFHHKWPNASWEVIEQLEDIVLHTFSIHG